MNAIKMKIASLLIVTGLVLSADKAMTEDWQIAHDFDMVKQWIDMDSFSRIENYFVMQKITWTKEHDQYVHNQEVRSCSDGSIVEVKVLFEKRGRDSQWKVPTKSFQQTFENARTSSSQESVATLALWKKLCSQI